MIEYSCNFEFLDTIYAEQKKQAGALEFLRSLLMPPFLWKSDLRNKITDFITLQLSVTDPKAVFTLGSVPSGLKSLPISKGIWTVNLSEGSNQERIAKRLYSEHLNTVFAFSSAKPVQQYLSKGWYHAEGSRFEAGSGSNNDWFKGDDKLFKLWDLLISICQEGDTLHLLAFTHDCDYLVYCDGTYLALAA